MSPAYQDLFTSAKDKVDCADNRHDFNALSRVGYKGLDSAIDVKMSFSRDKATEKVYNKNWKYEIDSNWE